MVLAFTNPLVGTTTPVITMTSGDDLLIACEWYDQSQSKMFLGFYDENTAFPGTPTWSTDPVLASAITTITVYSLAGDDRVNLLHLDVTNFPSLTRTYIEGDAGADILVGSFVADEIRGGEDRDVIGGLDGADMLYGGPDNDEINGGNDGDYIEGNAGDDSPLEGDGGVDIIRGNDGSDYIDGGDGGDTLYGGAQNDTILGGSDTASDYIEGNEDNDIIHGYGGGDEIRGNAGEDTIYGGDGGDLIYGGADNDTISGEADSDIIHGEAGTDTINGGTHNDQIFGGTEGDTLNGEDGDDWIEGGAGNDAINGGNDKDILWSNSGSIDQPWDGVGGTAGWYDMKGTGPASDGACDLEDNHPECSTTGEPTPSGDTYSVGHNSTLSVAAAGVLGNDTPIPGDTSAMTAILVYSPDHAEDFSLQANGSFSYDPVNTFVGTDYFYYRVSQSGIESKSLGIVAINVTNAPPITGQDSAFTTKNVPVTFNVLNNDGDYDGDDLDISVIVTPPAHGTLTTNFETGEITYTPAADYMGGDSFGYKATDGFAETPAGVSIMVGGMLRLDGNSLPNISRTSGFDVSDVIALENAAAQRWVDAGADSEDVRERLEGLIIQVLDLPGDALAFSAPGILVVDINGAGHDWFVDSTPFGDDEFALFTARTERQALAGSRAYGRVDLLTVLMHETGHFLGLDHSEDQHNVMAERLPTGTRRFPSPEDVDLAILNGLGDEDGRNRRR